MSTSTALRPSVRAALTALIDYAGLFPPAQLPMQQASDEYRKEQTGPYAWMLGRFIVQARNLGELPAQLSGPFSVIVQRNAEALREVAERRRNGLRVQALEMALTPGDTIDMVLNDVDISGNLDDLPLYLEIPRSTSWGESLTAALRELAEHRLGAKIRCGGLTADAFPSVEEVAAFVDAAARAGVAFKATAGLHHPVRHRDRASGFMMHGFLNILAAASLARHVDRETLIRIVAEEDAEAFDFDDESFAWRDESVHLAELERVRKEGFVGYGSCSFSEPVEDLGALGILPR